MVPRRARCGFQHDARDDGGGAAGVGACFYAGGVLIGTIRPVATATVEARSLTEAHELLQAECPAGTELADAPVTMGRGATLITAARTLVRRDSMREIEAEDMDALRAKVPKGWILLNMRKL